MSSCHRDASDSKSSASTGYVQETKDEGKGLEDNSSVTLTPKPPKCKFSENELIALRDVVVIEDSTPEVRQGSTKWLKVNLKVQTRESAKTKRVENAKYMNVPHSFI